MVYLCFVFLLCVFMCICWAAADWHFLIVFFFVSLCFLFWCIFLYIVFYVLYLCIVCFVSLCIWCFVSLCIVFNVFWCFVSLYCVFWCFCDVFSLCIVCFDVRLLVRNRSLDRSVRCRWSRLFNSGSFNSLPLPVMPPHQDIWISFLFNLDFFSFQFGFLSCSIWISFQVFSIFPFIVLVKPFCR